MDRDSPKLVFVSLGTLQEPPSGIIEHLKDHWWVVDPEKGAVFYKIGKRFLSPQCNPNYEVAKRICASMYPWAEIQKISNAYRSVNISDYT